MARLTMRVTAVTLVVIAFAAANVDHITPLEDPSSVVPEGDFMESVASGKTVEISGEVLQQKETTNSDSSDKISDNIDDPQDADAYDSPRTDSIGNNEITGAKISKDDNGMADTTHHYYDPRTQISRVKSPGYTTQDTKISGGDVAHRGHYYMGTGRRRIGAGYGRRRAPVEIKIEDMTPAQKAAIDKLDVWQTKPLAEMRKEAADYDFSVPGREEEKAIPLTKKQVKEFAAYIFHLKTGPRFFRDANYQGPSIAPGKSLPRIMDKNGVRGGKVPNLTAVRIPKGWCVKLFTEEQWKGESTEICGPKNIWSLSTLPLTKTYERHGLNYYKASEDAGKADAKRVAAARETTWDNNVRSFLVTKWSQIREKPKESCPCEKKPIVISLRKTTLYGKLECQRSHGGKSKAVVDMDWCNKSGVHARHPIKKLCPVCTLAPTKAPTRAPTKAPTRAPTKAPTRAPTTRAPTKAPTSTPTKAPTKATKLNDPIPPAPSPPGLCSPAKTLGREFYTWEAKGRHCYHIITGKVLEQDYTSKSKAKCNKAGFRNSVVIGRGGGTGMYSNGDSKHCPGGKKRSAKLTIIKNPAAKSHSSVVTEPSACYYKVTVTSPHC